MAGGVCPATVQQQVDFCLTEFGVGPFQAIKTCLTKSFQFSGRASRSEFWWFVVLAVLGLIVVAIIEDQLGNSAVRAFNVYHPLLGLYALAVLLPLHAAGARRLQDTNWPRWVALAPLVITIVCVAGMIIQLGFPPYYDLKGLGWFLAWLAIVIPFSFALVIGLLREGAPFSAKLARNDRPIPGAIGPDRRWTQ